MVKNAFCFILKDLFVLEMLKFMSCLFDYEEKPFDKKAVISYSTFLTSQTGKQTLTIYILYNVLGSKGNQAMKFGQLIEYNRRNIFLEELYRKCVGEASPRPFYKKSKFSKSLN